MSYGEQPSQLINETLNSIQDSEIGRSVGMLCGAKFCPGITAASNPNLTPPDSDKIQMLMFIFLALMVTASFLVGISVDPLKRYEMGRKGSGSELTGCRLLSVTIKQFMQIKQILLLPITMVKPWVFLVNSMKFNSIFSFHEQKTKVHWR